MTRSFAGCEVDVKPYLEMAKRQMQWESENGVTEGLRARLEATGLDLEKYLTGCNAHLVSNPLIAIIIKYFDIYSLYPAAGTSFFLLRWGLFLRERERETVRARVRPTEATTDLPTDCDGGIFY